MFKLMLIALFLSFNNVYSMKKSMRNLLSKYNNNKAIIIEQAGTDDKLFEFDGSEIKTVEDLKLKIINKVFNLNDNNNINTNDLQLLYEGDELDNENDILEDKGIYGNEERITIQLSHAFVTICKAKKYIKVNKINCNKVNFNNNKELKNCIIVEEIIMANKLIREVENNNINNVRLLINAGINVNIRNEDGETALTEAAKGGAYNINMMKLLLNQDNIDVNLKNTERDWTALHAALRTENIETVKLLLNRDDIDVNIQWMGSTPLMLAIYYCNRHCNDSNIIIDRLLKINKIDVNAQDLEGNTALIIASQHRYDNIVKALLKVNGININIKNKKGEKAKIKIT